MKRRIEQKFRKVFTFIMSVIMVVETVNCVSLTALASEGSVSAGDAINKELIEQVSEAEKAAIAADEAAKAAEAALKAAQQLSDEAADAALETAPDGTYTETVSDSDGNSVEVPVLKDKLDDAITDAENKVQDANNSIQDSIDAINALAAQAVEDTDVQLKNAEAAADDAAAAAEKAKEELAKAEKAKDYYTAQKAADAAANAYKEAQKAADAAGKAYEAAQDILKAAQDAVDDAIRACDASTEDAINTAQKAIDDAQAALDAAKAIVDKAEIEYAAAKANLDAAEDAAVKAAETVEAIADDIVGMWTDEDATITESTAKKEEIDAVIAAHNTMNSGYFQYQSDLVTADKAPGDTKFSLFGVVLATYTEEEIQDAIERKAQYENAKELIKNSKYKDISLDDLYKKSAQELDKIIAAGNAKKLNQNNATVDQAVSEATEKTLEKFVYQNDGTEISYLDKEKQDMYNDLLKQLKDSKGNYVFCNDKLEEYKELTSSSNFWDIKNFFARIAFELDNSIYAGFDFNDFTFVIDPNGLSLGYTKTKNNTIILTSIKNGALYIAEVDELEFATYSATFDKVAAAQAANRAADAAVKEEEAKKKLERAKQALQIAQERLDALKLKKMDLEKALDDLAKAKQNVDLTKDEWDAAKKSAKDAMEAAEAAKLESETKPVKTAFYVLNRGMSQPSEVKSYPKENYSKPGIIGELYSGENYSYVSLYKKGIKDEALVSQYLKVEPTAEQLAASGVVLKEGESIKWYVIKTENDGYHVDGFIVNQRFNINVLYGYKDSEDQFVEFTKADGSTYAQSGTFVLGNTYEFESPIIDEYIPEISIVTGVASADMTIEVVYTKEEVAPVIINYYRGSLTGTLLKSVPLDVAVSKRAGYATTITANWLNTAKPTDCNNGVLVNYYYSETEEAWVANIVYSVIPFEEPPTPPAPTPTPTPTPRVEEVPVITVNEESTPTTVRTIATTTSTPVVDDEEEDVVEVEEEETPLANAPEKEKEATDEVQDVVNIEEEETPLASGGNCWIHWLILLITAAYTLYELVRCVARNKKIKELSDSNQSVEA